MSLDKTKLLEDLKSRIDPKLLKAPNLRLSVSTDGKAIHLGLLAGFGDGTTDLETSVDINDPKSLDQLEEWLRDQLEEIYYAWDM